MNWVTFFPYVEIRQLILQTRGFVLCVSGCNGENVSIPDTGERLSNKDVFETWIVPLR